MRAEARDSRLQLRSALHRSAACRAAGSPRRPLTCSLHIRQKLQETIVNSCCPGASVAEDLVLHFCRAGRSIQRAEGERASSSPPSRGETWILHEWRILGLPGSPCRPAAAWTGSLARAMSETTALQGVVAGRRGSFAGLSCHSTQVQDSRFLQQVEALTRRVAMHAVAIHKVCLVQVAVWQLPKPVSSHGDLNDKLKVQWERPTMCPGQRPVAPTNSATARETHSGCPQDHACKHPEAELARP